MIVRCPSCGAPPSLESKKIGACEYCGTLLGQTKAIGFYNEKDDTITLFSDCEPIGTLVSKGLITMNEARRARWWPHDF